MPPTLADPQAIQQSAANFLRAVLTRYCAQPADRQFTGLACECDPGAASLYVHLSDRSDAATVAVEDWPYTYVEQDVSDVTPPAWFAEYDDLQCAYYQTETVPYAEIEQALAAVLAGVAAALTELARDGTLQRCGFVTSPCLSVVTEDDDSPAVGLARVAVDRRTS
jgi:hypothetical protein